MKPLPSIARNIKILREYTGLTGEEFAAQFGITRAQLVTYESGRIKKVDARFVFKLLEYFGLTEQQLYNEVLSVDQIKPTGRTKSALEIQLEEKDKQLALYENTVQDLRKIIALLEQKRP